MLAEAAHFIFDLVDHVGRCVRTQEVMYGPRVRRDLLILGAAWRRMSSGLLRRAWYELLAPLS